MKKRPAILGGEKTRTKPFPRRITMGDEEKQAVQKVMDSDVLSAFFGSPGDLFLGGPLVKEFEANWAKQYGFKHAISVNSWTSGLIIALGSVGIEPGDEVICSSYTMSASASCCFYYGAIPVFADVDSVTYCIDPKSFEKSISPRTKAIIVVHLFGGIANMDEILRIASKHNIKVIEDAAQAPGIKYHGKPVGALGDIGGFSLNYHKHIHTGEGGMLATNNDEIAEMARAIRNHGENIIESKGSDNFSNLVGGNFRLTEIQAAIGIQQLKKA
jgi:perosamine synthetase